MWFQVQFLYVQETENLNAVKFFQAIANYFQTKKLFNKRLRRQLRDYYDLSFGKFKI